MTFNSYSIFYVHIVINISTFCMFLTIFPCNTFHIVPRLNVVIKKGIKKSLLYHIT